MTPTLLRFALCLLLLVLDGVLTKPSSQEEMIRKELEVLEDLVEIEAALNTHADEKREENEQFGSMFARFQHMYSVSANTRTQGKRELLDPDLSSPNCPGFDDDLPTIDCSSSTKYREVTGVCNNVENPYYGAANRFHRRLQTSDGIAIAYGDGVSTPRNTTTENSSVELANVRTISNALFKKDDIYAEPEVTIQYGPSAKKVSLTDLSLSQMVMQMGQFLDHDFIETPAEGDPADSSDCCNPASSNYNHPNCFPIYVPPNDPVMLNEKTCMGNKRSAQFSDCYLNSISGEKVEFKNQKNEITTWIDASGVYGSTVAVNDVVRQFEDGLLKVQEIKGKEFLPPDDPDDDHNICMDGVCETKTGTGCMNCGDIRCNEQPGLLALHNLFVKFHNYVAGKLNIIGSKKSTEEEKDEFIYQETRKYVSACLQHTVYTEFLPAIFNDKFLKKEGLLPESDRLKYDPSIDPTMTSIFGIEYRIGHGLIRDTIKYVTEDRIVENQIPLSTTFFEVDKFASQKDDYEKILRFYMFDALPTGGLKVEEQIRSHLFRGTEKFGNDLIGLNLQRGRDWGTVTYMGLRRHCGYNEDLSDIPDETQEIIKQLYGITGDDTAGYSNNIEDIDAFVGMMAEEVLADSIMGWTGHCILVEFFKDVSLGDRFFYDHKEEDVNGDKVEGGLTVDQLAEVRKVNLASIICVASEITQVQEHVYRVPHAKINPIKECKEIGESNFNNYMKGIEGYPFPVRLQSNAQTVQSAGNVRPAT